MKRVLVIAAAAAAAAVGFTAAPVWADAYPNPGEGIGDFPRPQTIRVQVGDIDGFHPGDPLDEPSLSDGCCCILAYCESLPGMSGRQCLDHYGDDRPVGLSVPFQVPDGSRIVSADLTIAFLAVSQYACNDVILTAPSEYPVFALRDLIGCEPDVGQVYTATVDLARVPTRTSGAPAWDGHWAGPPDTSTDLLAALRREGRLDMVLGDDISVDYAVLRITWDYPSPPFGGGKVPVLIAPNPGGGGDVTLSFSLARRALAVIEIFDVTGRRVAIPASEVMGPGALRVTWNGRDDDGAAAAPGTYFVRLRTEEGEGTAKLLRLR